MKRLLIIVAAIVGVLLAIVIALPFLIPGSVYKSQIENAATKALGTQVTLSGSPRLSVFPWLSVGIDGVSVDNPDGFEGEYLLEAGKIRGTIRLFPLFSQRVEVQELALSDVTLRLIRTADGRANWEQLGPAQQPMDQEEEDPLPPADGEIESAASEADAPMAGIDRARLVNADVYFQDAQSGQTIILQEFTASARLPSLEAQFTSAGEGKLNGQAFDYDVSIENLANLAAQSPAKVTLDLLTDYGRVEYDGSVVLGDVPRLDADIRVSSDTLAQMLPALGVELPFAANIVEEVRLDGRISGPVEALSLDISASRVALRGLTADYQGKVVLNETPELDGRLTVDGEDLQSILGAFEIPLPEITEVAERISLSATLRGAMDSLEAEAIEATLDLSGMRAEYAGKFALIGAEPSLNGRATIRVTDAAPVLVHLPQMELPPDLIGQVRFEGELSGAASELTVSAITLEQNSALLETRFSGNVSLSPNGAINGTLRMGSPDLPALLRTFGSDAETSTAYGQDFNLTGTTSGTIEQFSLDNLRLALGNRTATGRLGFDLGGTRPKAIADLDFGALDLSPFLGSTETKTEAQQASGIAPWDNTPFDLDALSLVDADIKLRAGTLTLDEVELSNASISATLKSGDLAAIFAQSDNRPGFEAFGGDWSGRMALTTSGERPSLTLTTTAQGVAAREMLGALTGFDGLSGVGALSLDLRSTGNSLSDLVSTLGGSVETSLGDGALRGVNLAQLVRTANNLQETLRAGNLSIETFRTAWSPGAETDFTAFDGILSLSDGIATIKALKIDNPVVGIDATGTINLGEQSMDLRLIPRLDRNAQGAGKTIGVGGIAVPLRISGPWTGPSYTPDVSAVRSALTASVRDRALDEVRGRVGDELGTLLDGVIPGSAREERQSDEARNDTVQADQKGSNGQSLEEQLLNEGLDTALGAVFGRRSDDKEEDNKTDEEDADEEDGN